LKHYSFQALTTVQRLIFTLVTNACPRFENIRTRGKQSFKWSADSAKEAPTRLWTGFRAAAGQLPDCSGEHFRHNLTISVPFLFYPSNLPLHKVDERGGSHFLLVFGFFGRALILWDKTILNSRSTDIAYFKGKFNTAALHVVPDSLF